MSKSQLEQLRELTTIVVDTGDIESIKAFRPTDATTNPSLILEAAGKPQYEYLIEEAISYSRSKARDEKERSLLLMDKLFVNFGIEILKVIPGRVSTEVDSRLSFDTRGNIQRAKQIVQLYETCGIDRERILIKLASTWEGAQAARELEKEGIHCNMTLLFSMAQAIACAEAKATLISPFVGRILDWYKKDQGVEKYAPAEDPGVKSVTEIYNYFKKFDYTTQVMGASFRNKDEITELAGCDLLTIAPKLLKELETDETPLECKLDAHKAKEASIDRVEIDERLFRWQLNESAMATDKLSDGIRRFAADADKLEKTINARIGNQR